MKLQQADRAHRILRSIAHAAPYAVVGLAMLGLSELVWLWQTWKVRRLLDLLAGVQP